VDVDAGHTHTVARLADGRVLTWGWEGMHESGMPALPGLPLSPPTARHVDAYLGHTHSLFTLSDGTIQAFGRNTEGQCNPPVLPSGVHYKSAVAHWLHSAALCSDGRVVAWGWNLYGQCNPPALPPGMRYTALALGNLHSVALRSDGQAVGWGDNFWGQISIPPPPAGTTYIAVDTSQNGTVLLRSDGQFIAAGGYQLQSPPALPPGVKNIDLAIGFFIVSLRSDGEVDIWEAGAGGAPWLAPTPLPFGVYYTQVECGDHAAILRRSDGQVVPCGQIRYRPWHTTVPPLEPGTSYVQVSASWGSFGARVGPTNTYVGFAPGCAGSRPRTRLVPRETPRIGQTMQLTLFDLPVDIALLAMGFQSASPIDLASLGMPGCSWNIQIGATGVLVGQTNQAVWQLPIPDAPGLVGLQFYNQALVLDPAAGNGFGAVVSDAAVGIIGYP
jgi:hypothetical protein